MRTAKRLVNPAKTIEKAAFETLTLETLSLSKLNNK